MRNLTINVGDYVRTEYGISKVEEDRRIHFGLIHPVIDILKKEVIIKSSPNIIDLIEEDDFINQARVSEIIKKTKDSIRFMADSDYEFSTELKEKEITSIVTKEQFESMEYKIER